MKILSGPYAGCTARAHQYANDWITADLDDGPQNVILKPFQVQLTDNDDWTKFADQDPIRHGRFWREWRLNDDGTFTSLRARGARSKGGEAR